MLSWAAWLPELANAFVVIPTVILVVASLVRQYSNAELADNIVDTYEAAAWATLTTYVFAAIGIACASVAWVAARARLRRRLALLQVLVLLLCVGTAAYQQHILAARVERLHDVPQGKVP
jgi:cell division protein FtsW (lipid II flippase)